MKKISWWCPPPRRRSVALNGAAWLSVGVVAGITAIAHLTVATRYGWHRDGYRKNVITWRSSGYVDQPPLTPLVPRFADLLPGGLLPLRIVAITAQIDVLLVAALARELGGARRAQTIAAACVAASPVTVGGSLFIRWC